MNKRADVVGIDIGGTFADFIIFRDGTVSICKIPTNPYDFIGTIEKGLKLLRFRKGVIIHGTTLATNTILERKGAKTVLLTTKGFADIIEIGRQNRRELYKIDCEKPRPLIPHNLRLEVSERTLSNGSVVRRPTTTEINRLKHLIKRMKIESVCISFLNSYINPKNEKAVEKQLKNSKCFLSTSCRISQQFREFERTSTAVINAYVGPKIKKYMEQLRTKYNRNKIEIMSSAGGSLSITEIVKRPVETVLSGPAAGVIAASRLSELTGYKNLITFDMGGTSTDVSIIKDHKFSLTKESLIDNLPIQLPQIEILTIGQGGGSVLWLDSAGVLRSGPYSQGSFPGPACYGNNGKLPTITDAFVHNRVLRPENFRFKQIFPGLSDRSFIKLSQKMKVKSHDIAENAIKIAAFNMSMAIRKITINKGIDPRNFMLLAFGGAGPLYGCEITEQLNLQGVIIPEYAGNFCALGCYLSDLVKEETKTVFIECAKGNIEQINKHIKELTGKYNGSIDILCEMRYQNQNYELIIPFEKNIEKMRRMFDKKHKEMYGFCRSDLKCIIVNLIVRKITARKRTLNQKSKQAPRYNKITRSKIYFCSKWVDSTFVRREQITTNSTMRGPAVIIEDSATTYIKPGFKVRTDKYANLIITRK